ncbi:MAG TPA: TetR/AcrR family transcriptional regulator C-terminal domain-containing protein [Bacillota bacterium]|nr:TetR/AcrR family transcriptional regulator C-terminal domain-containing protein [Bacillota bacterium]
MAPHVSTKNALTAALKKLMAEKPFAKISVGDICEECSLNRKSFYYHFRDKYELVNWVFTTEFVNELEGKEIESDWDFFECLCDYFYTNRDFYRNALSFCGQNSFNDYFHEFLSLPISQQISKTVLDDENIDFYVGFFTDSVLHAIERWIAASSCRPPEEFTALLKKALLAAAEKLMHDNEQSPADGH